MALMMSLQGSSTTSNGTATRPARRDAFVTWWRPAKTSRQSMLWTVSSLGAKNNSVISFMNTFGAPTSCRPLRTRSCRGVSKDIDEPWPFLAEVLRAMA
eukprot:5542793-Alexandrium_andersonii.AAC.1